MMELDAIRRAMDEGVPDGPDVRCGTCARWDYQIDVKGFKGAVVQVGICADKSQRIAEDGTYDGAPESAVCAATGECDGATCIYWREYEG